MSGEAGTGNVVEAVRHMRQVTSQIRKAQLMSDAELYSFAKELSAPYELLKQTAKLGRLPVVCFSAGGIATPADAALMMQLGCDGVFVYASFLSQRISESLTMSLQRIWHLQGVESPGVGTSDRSSDDALQRPQSTRRSIDWSRTWHEGRRQLAKARTRNDGRSRLLDTSI